MLLLGMILLLMVFLFLCCFMPKPERPQFSKTRIACIGDSITFGAGVIPNRKRNAWPYLLEKALGSSFQVINYGLSWATLQMEGNLPYKRFHFLKKVEAAKPETVLFMLGSNDSKPHNWQAERFREQYEETVHGLLQKEYPYHLILMVPPCAFPNRIIKRILFGIDNEVIGGDIRSIVFAVGDKYRIPVIDLYEFTKEHPEYFMDGIHPNRAGNVAIAEYLCKTAFLQTH